MFDVIIILFTVLSKNIIPHSNIVSVNSHMYDF